jgi:hypothetical protein
MTARGAPRSLDVLRRLAQSLPPSPADLADEHCEMCGAPVAAEHGHVVDLEDRSLLCACRPCWLLFPEGAQQRYRSVPERHLAFPGFRLAPGRWDDLDIPVGLAFFFRSSLLGRVVALYPGPAGATESTLPLGAWDGVEADNPDLAELRSDVEALLIRAGDRPACTLVPVDRCYELVGRLRQVWRGFDGGADARAVLAAFESDVAARSRPVTSRRAR